MLERHLAVAALRQAARTAGATWRRARALAGSPGTPERAEAAKLIETAAWALKAAGAAAVPALLEAVAKAILDGRQTDLTAADTAIATELDRLERADYRPTLYLYGIATQYRAVHPRGAFFLPATPLAPERSDATLEGFATAARQYRYIYLRTLLALVRAKDPTASLKLLRDVLVKLENRRPPPAFALPIDAAIACFDAALANGARLDHDTKLLLSRIDCGIRSAAEAGRPADPLFVSRLLFAAAQAQPVTARITRLQTRYGLARFLDGVEPDVVQPARWDHVDEAWADCALAWEVFVRDGASPLEAAARLVDACGGHPALAEIAAVVRSLTEAVVSGRVARSIELDDHVFQVLARLQEVAGRRADAARVAALAEEESTLGRAILRQGGMGATARGVTEPPLALVMTEAAAEVGRAGAAAAGGDTATASAHLGAARAAACIAGLDDTAALLQDVGTALARGAVPGEALTALRQHCELIVGGGQAAAAIAEEVRGLLGRAPLDHPLEAGIDRPADPEIFAIFAEETRQLVADMRAAATAWEADAMASAQSVRRACHTLKGSARLAGLVHLGDAMWVAEDTFNDWLRVGELWPLDLRDLAVEIARTAEHCVERLARMGQVSVEDDALRKLAAALRARARPGCGERDEPRRQDALLPELGPTRRPDAPLEVTAAPGAESPPAADMGAHAVGGDAADAELLALFADEAPAMLGILRREAGEIGSGGMSLELIRAAHTLVGLGRTVGFHALARMARPIEQWASRHYDTARPVSEDELRILDGACQQIDETLALDPTAWAGDAAPAIADWLAVFDGGAGCEDAEDVARSVVQPASGGIGGSSSSEGAVWCGNEADAADRALPVSAPAAPCAPRPTIPRDAGDSAGGAPASPAASPATECLPTVGESETLAVDDLDGSIMPLFADEADEIFTRLDAALRGPLDGAALAEVHRLVHTLKGGARLAGAMQLGRFLHRLEDRTAAITAAGSASERLGPELRASLDQARVMLSECVAQVKRRGDSPREPERRLSDRRGDGGIFRIDGAQIESLGEAVAQIRMGREAMRTRLATLRNALGGLTEPAQRIEQLAAGVMAESELRIDAGTQIHNKGAFDALEMDRYSKLQEMTRRLQEAAADVSAVLGAALVAASGIAEGMARGQGADALLEGRVEAVSRTSPQILEARLAAIARNATAGMGKAVTLSIPPTRVNIERVVLEALAPALEHLVRNAVAHGIEPIEVRAAAGKLPAGQIEIRVTRDGDRARFVVSDDGAGVDLAALRRRFAARLPAGASEEAVLDLLFESGVTTAETVTEVAGRGVGLDVVRETVRRFNGDIAVSTAIGAGTRFTLTVPLSSSLLSGILLRAGAGAAYIVPAALVRRIAALPPEAHAGGAAAVTIDGKSLEVVRLADLLATPTPALAPARKLLVPKKGGLAIAASEVEFVERVLVRPCPPMVASRGLLGYSVLHDGTVAVVLDPVELTRPAVALTSTVPAEKPWVLIVDDSITVRKVTAKLLEREGYSTQSAENGLVALDHLRTGRLPVAVLMDIEMPVMDGFEATQSLKLNERTRNVPVIIISSRHVDKHIDYARQMGADHFLGKPYQEAQLLALLDGYRADAAGSATLRVAA